MCRQRGRHERRLRAGTCYHPIHKATPHSNTFSLFSHQQQLELDGTISFIDESDPDFEYKEVLRELDDKASQGHWKAATRKLKKLTRRYGDREIPIEAYTQTLEACMANRLQGARASEPARKIMEQMFEQGYRISESAGNYCIKNCLGEEGPHSTHQGFGGIDTALAMLATLETAEVPVYLDTYDKVIVALAREGSIDHALSMLKEVVQHETPPLSTFAAVARGTTSDIEDLERTEKVLTVLTYAKAAGYELDEIGATDDGRLLLASGVIGAERLNNDALGFRLLTAASNAVDDEGVKGDLLVAASSNAAQRASTLIHKRAITKATEDGNWKLAVKVLELMLQRDLKPSSWIWRNVVTCCAKAAKSRKATALLLDWVKLYEGGKADKPPLSVFNTCVNVCEICDEHEVTLVVLDSMRKTHDTEGNIITFNIALKRLAKLGNSKACEGIIVGMLQAGVEPSVVSYTTAIASCASQEDKQPTVAYEWLKRMRSRKVNPNVLTYNTALAACLDGTLDSTFLASKIATEMLADVDVQLAAEDESYDEYTDVVPNGATKFVTAQLMKQLKQNWIEGAIDKRTATETVRVPLRQLVDFQKTEAASKARAKLKKSVEEDQASSTRRGEAELEFESASTSHRSAEV